MIDTSFVLVGGLTGFVVGLTGVGGGALMTPILLLVFGISPTTAIATDLWFAAITKLIGARIHHAQGQVDWQVVRRLWWGSLPLAILVVGMVSQGGQLIQVDGLAKALAVVILVTALGLLMAPRLLASARQRRITEPERFKAIQPLLTVVSGGVLGLCVALTSVGAGALGSVMLLYLYPLRMKPHRLVATDIVHAIPLAVVAGTGYLWAGMVDASMLFSLLVGSVPAVVLGSLSANRVSGRFLQVLLALVLLGAAAKILV